MATNAPAAIDGDPVERLAALNTQITALTERLDQTRDSRDALVWAMTKRFRRGWHTRPPCSNGDDRPAMALGLCSVCYPAYRWARKLNPDLPLPPQPATRGYGFYAGTARATGMAVMTLRKIIDQCDPGKRDIPRPRKLPPGRVPRFRTIEDYWEQIKALHAEATALAEERDRLSRLRVEGIKTLAANHGSGKVSAIAGISAGRVRQVRIPRQRRPVEQDDEDDSGA